MKRAHKFALVVGIILGLFGQTATVAANPIIAIAFGVTAPAAVPADCAGMRHDNDGNPLPCHQVTLACLAGMGCLPLLALNSPSTPVAELAGTALLLVWPPYAVLHGRTAPPELHPPNTLA